jgi:hypothetical protein
MGGNCLRAEPDCPGESGPLGQREFQHESGEGCATDKGQNGETRMPER